MELGSNSVNIFQSVVTVLMIFTFVFEALNGPLKQIKHKKNLWRICYLLKFPAVYSGGPHRLLGTVQLLSGCGVKPEKISDTRRNFVNRTFFFLPFHHVFCLLCDFFFF